MTYLVPARPIPDLTPQQVARFWLSVARPEGHLGQAGCWEWAGNKGSGGYGHFSIPGTPRQQRFQAHRVAYFLFNGPIPEGMTLDHLCSNRACVRPSHLDPVTQAENNMRAATSPTTQNALKTHCIRGHAFTPKNTHVSSEGRRCKECDRLRKRSTYHEKKNAARGAQ